MDSDAIESIYQQSVGVAQITIYAEKINLKI